jgi:cyclic beta-1,2-glucan synthetase
VWLGFFLYDILGRMLPVCEQMHDTDRQQQYCASRQQLAKALNEAGWDGQWYRRAFFDDGTPLGSADSEECHVDALAQAWAVLSGAAPPDRAKLALRAVEEHLVDEAAGIIRLLTPPCDQMERDPGYLKGYLPGVRENGGQYTHGVLWFIRALAELGHGTRATRLLEMLTPIHRSRTSRQVAVYQIEPYVVAADVYGEPPHVGRGGWSWYTGSAGWMLRVILESLLGLRIENGTAMLLGPSIAADWTSCRFEYRRADTTYRVAIENPRGREHGASTATLDGNPVEVRDGAARIPLSCDGRPHDVIVRM